MWQGPLLALMVLLAITGLRAQATGEGRNIRDIITPLTDVTFEKFIKSNDLVIVHFYVPWCGHCKKFSTEYVGLADAGKKRKDSVQYTILNADDHEDLANSYGVYSYPSILFFVNQSPVQYQGARSSKDILRWIDGIRKVAPKLVTEQELSRVTKKRRTVVALLGRVGKELEVFMKCTRGLKGARVVHLDVSRQFSKLNNSIWPENMERTIVIFRGGSYRRFEGQEFTVENLKVFIDYYSGPLIGSLNTGPNLERVFYRENTASLIYYEQKPLKPSHYKRLKGLAIDFQDDLSSFLLRPTDKYRNQIEEFLNVRNLKRPVSLWLVHNSPFGTHSYPLLNPFTKKNLYRFIQRWANGRISPQTPNVYDKELILDLSNPDESYYLKRNKKSCCILHYLGEECEVSAKCRRKLKKFRSYAIRLHFLPELEFCHLNYDYGYRFTRGEFYKEVRTPMPSISLAVHGETSLHFLASFDWKFTTLLSLLKRVLPNETAHVLSTEFPRINNFELK